MNSRLNPILMALTTVVVSLATGCGHEVESPAITAPPAAAAGLRGPATPDLLCVDRKDRKSVV